MTNFFSIKSKSQIYKCLGSLILMFIFSVNANAQTTVTGTVSDSNGLIPGANVIVKGTKNGVATGFDGNYTISNVPANGVLVFSFLGLKTKEGICSG